MTKRIVFPLVIVLALIGGLWWWHTSSSNDLANLPDPPIERQQGSGPGSPQNTGQDPVANNNPALPKTVSLPVPFTPQAPTANWDQLHNEACEEASVLMAAAYFGGNHNPTLSAEQAEAEISKLVQWEQEEYGYHLDTTTPETAKMIEDVYGLKTKIIENFSVDDLKSELTEGRLVIISVDGRLLGNPNFRQPGPPHHMFVITGYNSTGMVTNDPGTRRGRNYTYSFDTIYEAAGDWEHNQHAVNRSKKMAIVVWKE